VIMDRDFQAKKQGYSGRSYIQTLEKGLLPHYKPLQAFVQDNAPIHNCKESKKWLESHGIWVLEWPPYSPDLNPIEHLWWKLKKLLYTHYPHLNNMGESAEDLKALQAALKACWRMIPGSLIKRLILSMPRRLEALRKAKGRQTKY